MKTHLAHIENNLRTSFNQNISVLAAYNSYGEELTADWQAKFIYQYLVSATKDGLDKWISLVTPAKVFVHRLDIQVDYDRERAIYNTSRRLVIDFKGIEFLEQKPNKECKEEIEKLLIACEFKTKREPKLLPLQFIKKHAPRLGEIYKMLCDLSKTQTLSCVLQNKWITDNRNTNGGYYIPSICFFSDNGKYSFPVYNLADTCTDEEIIIHFTNLVKPELFKNLLQDKNIAA